jgi:hypothetical protein
MKADGLIDIAPKPNNPRHRALARFLRLIHSSAIAQAVA